MESVDEACKSFEALKLADTGRYDFIEVCPELTHHVLFADQ